MAGRQVTLEAVPYFVGIGFLLACVFGVPLLRKQSHEAMLKGLGLEGVTVVPKFWSLSGLRIERSKWKGEVFFQAARAGGGRAGHLRYVVEFRVPVPVISLNRDATKESKVRTGDDDFDRKISVEGDPAFARKLLVPVMRERLMRLDEVGGRVLAIGEGSVEIDGPLPAGLPDLKRFLELCDAIVDGTVAAAGA
ncbi:MAG: hypothetical protein HY293_20780 [Planctomycetes bacterium]|nr:hypothetical protein [Planctomycetota bacterium]